MADSTTPKVRDLLAVRSRVSWGAIAAGAMVALAVYFVLNLAGVALGMELLSRGQGGLGPGAAVYAIAALLLAMFLGGWATSRLAVGESKLEAVLHGVILWGTLFAGLFWLIGTGVRVGFGALVSGAVGVAGDDTRTVTPGDSVSALARRYNGALGGENFVADLERAGVEKGQAEMARAKVREHLDRLRVEPGSLAEQGRDLAGDPDVRRAGGHVRQAAWWTLVGVLVSMAAAVVGSLTGSGEMLHPVPLLGVRRPPRPVHA